MIFSCQSVSKNFKLYDQITDQWLSHDLLQEFVWHWKVIFTEKNQLRTGDKIGLGFSHTNIYYFSAILAASELGLNLVVLDIHSHHPGLSDFFPLDLFLSGPGLPQDKHNFYQSKSRQTEYWHVWEDYQIKDIDLWKQYTQFLPQPTDALLLCSSSGTTDRPKKVHHSQQFLCAVSSRNQKLWKFDGNVLHVRNLHHGSSLATYFMPALMSDQCTGHYVYNFNNLDHMDDLVQFCCDYKINHIQLPTTQAIELFLTKAAENQVDLSGLNLYTLSYINPGWQSMIKQCNINSIVSVFGCNETSGPLFVSTLTSDCDRFDPKIFKSPDDFYSFDFNEQQQLVVKQQFLNQPVIMQDSFQRQGSEFVHLGRNDLTRINDVVVDVFWLLSLCEQQNVPGQVVVDKLHEKLYLALWVPEALNAVEQLNQDILQRYGNAVTISKVSVLNFSHFVKGIKLDHEALRETFRALT